MSWVKANPISTESMQGKDGWKDFYKNVFLDENKRYWEIVMSIHVIPAVTQFYHQVGFYHHRQKSLRFLVSFQIYKPCSTGNTDISLCSHSVWGLHLACTLKSASECMPIQLQKPANNSYYERTYTAQNTFYFQITFTSQT